MSKMDVLRDVESRLSKHVAHGYGRATETTLKQARAAHEDKLYEHAIDAENPNLSQNVRKSHLNLARYHDAGADKMDNIITDVRKAKDLIKEYGAGHDMSAHGEGKPYGAK